MGQKNRSYDDLGEKYVQVRDEKLQLEQKCTELEKKRANEISKARFKHYK